MKIILERLDDLLGMVYAHLYLLSQGVEGLIHQIVEEGQLIEDVLVGFLQHFLLEASWQLLNEGFFLLQAELLLDVDRLLDVVVDPPAELLRQVILKDKLLKNFEVSALLDVLSADIADKCPHAVNIVG